MKKSKPITKKDLKQLDNAIIALSCLQGMFIGIRFLYNLNIGDKKK